MYWLAVIISFLAMGYNEKRGHWPLVKKKGAQSGITGRADGSLLLTPPVNEPSSSVQEVK
jgi:high-affinity iron transporter